MQTNVVTYYLEVTDPDALRHPTRPFDDATLTRVDPPDGAINRAFYADIGRHWNWIDRRVWSDEQWQSYLDAGDIETWVLRSEGQRAGYIELQTQPDANVEIVYLGLLREFIGAGLGSLLLSGAVRRGFELGARRVWFHTCTLDDPRALAFYQSHGMTLYDQDESTVDLPD